MKDQYFEDLAKLYPDLFQKSNEEHFAIDNGWVNIVKVLCEKLSSRVDRARMYLRYGIEKGETDLSKLEHEVKEAIEELPVIQQVKEKFGTLRFYATGTTEEMQHYIEFAESMSQYTCERCGAAGEARNTGWVKVLCDKHHAEKAVEDRLNQEWLDNDDI